MRGADERVLLSPSFLVPGLLSLLASAALTWCLAALFTGIGFVAPFNPIVPQTRAPAALGGGLALGAGLILALFLGQLLGMDAGMRPLLPVFAAVPALILGIADDIRPFQPCAKLALQLAVAAFSILMVLGIPADTGGLALLLIGVAAGVLLMNAVNFLDVSDGYAAGTCAMSFLGLAVFWPPNPVAAGLVGACLGFLILNRPPAKIYMGDAGSLFLGLMGANLIAMATQERPWSTVAIMASTCFAVPLLELAIVTLIRWRKGLSIWHGSPDHSALRLQEMGFGKTRALVIAATAQLLLIAVLAGFRGFLPA